MLSPVLSTAFKKDVKRLKKSGKDMQKLRNLIILLTEEKELPQRYKDHSLVGNWQGYRDAHIESDWLLLYKIIENELHLMRTGSHSQLFK